MNHEGKSEDPDRQSSPHPHSSIFSRCNSIMFVADLGTDIIYYYSISPQ
jgi:6-phosphogluconolactonase